MSFFAMTTETTTLAAITILCGLQSLWYLSYSTQSRLYAMLISSAITGLATYTSILYDPFSQKMSETANAWQATLRVYELKIPLSWVAHSGPAMLYNVGLVMCLPRLLFEAKSGPAQRHWQLRNACLLIFSCFLVLDLASSARYQELAIHIMVWTLSIWLLVRFKKSSEWWVVMVMAWPLWIELAICIESVLQILFLLFCALLVYFYYLVYFAFEIILR